MSSMYGATGNKIPSGYQEGRIQQFTPEQMKLMQHLSSFLGPDSYLSRMAAGDESLFEQIEAPTMKQFAGMQGNLASRFSGMGMGGRRSSGFQNTANQAASDFAQQLQSRRQDLQRQAIGDIRDFGSMMLSQRPYDNFLTKKPDFLSQLMGGLGSGVDMFSKIAPFFI